MKNLQIVLCLIGLSFASVASAQDDKKSHSIGLQLNPYLDSYFFEGTFTKPVFAVRYGYHWNDKLSFGPEVSGSFVHHNSNQVDYNSSDLNLGGFVRYSLMPTSRIRPFIEASAYYNFHHFKSSTIVTQEGIGEEFSHNSLNGYLSPGVTLYSKNQKFSLDLMYKFSNAYFINGHKSVFSYRLNFNF
jgi:hypothetical protein